MIRRFQGLHQADPSAAGELPDGLFLVRVHKAHYRWHGHKPYYMFGFTVLEPKAFAGREISGHLYCSQKAIWKLTWFLRDFGYDVDLLGRDEVEDKCLLGLTGVIKISHVVVNGRSLIDLDGFAPASQWEELSTGSEPSAKIRDPEVA